MEVTNVPEVVRRRKKTEPDQTPAVAPTEEAAGKTGGYLCISRKAKEDQDTILIGGNIEIKVISIRGNSVRLGIRAGEKIPVDRAECAGRYSKS